MALFIPFKPVFNSLAATALLTAAFALPARAQQPAPAPVSPQSPNVLLIISDDLRPTLGCYGDELAKTPRIDGLARGGVRFERAYCQQAICAPSRASFLSGLRPSTLGIYDLETPLRSKWPDIVTMPQAFKNAGYETVSLGKVYHHGGDDAQSWTRRPRGGGVDYALPATRDYVARRRAEAADKGLKGLAAFHYARGPAVEAADVPDEVYRDGDLARQAVGQMRELKDKPFFLAVGFRLPHLPFAAPKKYWDLYRRDAFKVPPPTLPTAMPDMAMWDFGELRAYSDIPARKEQPVLSPEKTRELIHGYYASVSYVDAQVGLLLDALEELKLDRNTVVVLMSDHGYKLGEYGNWCKHSNMEIDTRAPLIVRAPFEGELRAGAASSALVEYVDVFPTLADLCGLPTPPQLEGVSVRPLLARPERAWKTAAFSLYPRHNAQGFSLRSGAWRYVEWRRGDAVVARELYDHSDSPIANANLADLPQYAARVDELAAQLRAGWKAALPEKLAGAGNLAR